jgi:pimeloyl-ACP methyl ester carboxylesterase
MAVVVLGGMGTGFQRLATERDARRHPPPGDLVRVDGHRLHVACIGTGEPTVVLDAGLGEWSLHWRGVQARLASVARVCAYDRGGYGWSEPGPLPRDGTRLAEELHLLLKNAEVAPPYLLVGHGTAGFHLRGYVRAHPDWVAGLALVDTVPAGMAELYERAVAPVRTRVRQATPAAQFGVLRFTGPPPGLGPQPGGATFQRQGAHPGFYETYLDEAAHVLDGADWADAAPLPPTLPVLVVANDAPLGDAGTVPREVSRQRYNRLWSHQQAEMERLTGRTRRVMLHDPGANLLLDDADAVAGALGDFVRRVRGG